METKVNNAGEQQPIDEKGRYTFKNFHKPTVQKKRENGNIGSMAKFDVWGNNSIYTPKQNKPQSIDNEIASLKEQRNKLSFFDKRRLELTNKIKELETQKQGKISTESKKPINNTQKEEKAKIEPKEEQDYMMSHRPTKSGITADDLTNQDNEIAMPEDYYEILEREAKYDETTRESLNQLKKVRNNPNGEITIYRATIGDKINNGDWITLSPSYAKKHNEHSLNGKGNIVAMKVKAKDIQFAGDDINEWGYFPK